MTELSQGACHESGCLGPILIWSGGLDLFVLARFQGWVVLAEFGWVILAQF